MPGQPGAYAPGMPGQMGQSGMPGCPASHARRDAGTAPDPGPARDFRKGGTARRDGRRRHDRRREANRMSAEATESGSQQTVPTSGPCRRNRPSRPGRISGAADGVPGSYESLPCPERQDRRAGDGRGNGFAGSGRGRDGRARNDPGLAERRGGDMIGDLLRQPRPTGMPTGNGTGSGNNVIGGGIAGIASKADSGSIMVYSDHSNYKEWEFIYDPMKDRPPPNPLTGAGIPAAQLGNTNGQSSPGTPASQLGSTAQGSQGFPSAVRPRLETRPASETPRSR